ncbi:hypothetical protein [Arenimonas alkanexedens]
MKIVPGLLFASLAALAALVALGAPAPARANGPHDCTNGCFIITCNAEYCSTWRCDGNGCRLMSSVPRQMVDEISVHRSSDARKAKPVVAPEVAHASVCPVAKPCAVYELTVDTATHLGDFDNLDNVVRQREALHE